MAESDAERELIDRIVEGNTDAARALLAAGVSPECRIRGYSHPDLSFEDAAFAPRSMTPLRAAMHTGHAAIVGPLVDAGATIRPDALMLTEPIDGDHVEVVRVLLDHGVPVDAEAGDLRTPLQSACARGASECAQLLLERGADATVVDDSGATTLILLAGAPTDRPELVPLLLDAGVPIDAKTTRYSKTTALLWALFNSNAGVATALVDAGANVKARSSDRGSALHYAALRGHEALVERLLDAGAKPNLKNSDRATPLLLAAQSGHAAIVRRLLDAGADPSPKNEGGYDALALARLHGHQEIVAMLG